jgi:hypothetical protein
MTELPYLRYRDSACSGPADWPGVTMRKISKGRHATVRVPHSAIIVSNTFPVNVPEVNITYKTTL